MKSEGKEAKVRGRQPQKEILRASETHGGIRTSNGINNMNTTISRFKTHRK